nr:MAG: hypothetical protein DIU68_00900 [Chloroflexota bacterium]
MLISLVLIAPVRLAQAQDAPGEFEIIRTALVEKFRVRMQQVAEWSWEQVDFTDGIESCIDEGERKGVNAPWGRRYLVTAFNGVTYEGRISYDQTIVVACDSPEHERLMAAAAQPPAPAEAPAGDEAPAAAPLPPPVAGAAASAGFALGGHVNNMNGQTFDAMRRSGMTWLKKQYIFNVGDSPHNVAGMIETAHANGFRILLGIVGKQEQMGDYPAYINAYAEFVGGVAALGADAIEVWNEPNIDREWPADMINGATYTQLLAAAYNAIKSANPGTLVISGAPAPTGYFGAVGCGAGGCNDDVFMRQMANAGAARYMDCIGLHYNEGIIPPSRTSGDPRGEYPTYYFRSMLQRGYGLFGGKQVCFTELGYLSGEGYDTPIPGNFGWAANTTVEQHAAWLAEAATLAARSGRVRLMIIWNVDFRDFTPTDPLGGYAMIRPDNGCPACDALAVVMGR